MGNQMHDYIYGAARQIVGSFSVALHRRSNTYLCANLCSLIAINHLSEPRGLPVHRGSQLPTGATV